MNLRNAPIRDLRPILGMVVGAAVGALAMYWLDPDSGTRRRSQLGGRTRRASRRTRRFMGRATRDLMQRSRGVLAGSQRSRRNPGDFTLHERVRARLGHVCSHPRAIGVAVRDGAVTLAGSILANEAAAVIAACRGIPGVGRVVDRMQHHTESEHVPDLQGAARPPRRWSTGLDTPSFQLLAGVAVLSAIGTLLTSRVRSASPTPEQLGEGEENPAYYRHFATTPPMAKSAQEE